MPKFNVIVEHQMGRDPAIERLQSFSEDLKQQYSRDVSEVNETWHEDGTLVFSITAMGMTINGIMNTTHDQVAVNGNLPFAALPFRGMIQNQIESELKRLLHDQA
jgi:antitoxin component of RelBE/YafQ-DinJ toxin-antitoxin module